MTKNIFDQFDDEKTGNIFDQFDEAPAPAEEKRRPEEKRSPEKTGLDKLKEVADTATDYLMTGGIVGDAIRAIFPEKKKSVMETGEVKPINPIETRGAPVTAEYAEGVRRVLETKPDEQRADIQRRAAQPYMKSVVAAQRRNIESNNAAPEPIRRAIGDVETRTAGLITKTGADPDAARMQAISDVLAGRATTETPVAEEAYDPTFTENFLRKTGDLGESVRQIPPSVVKGMADIAQMFTGGTVGKDLSDRMEEAISLIADDKSMDAKIKAAEFQRIMDNKQARPADGLMFLLNNPDFAAQIAIPSLGSMVIPVAAAGIAGRVAQSLKWVSALEGADKAAKLNAIRGAVGLVANDVMNAGDTFNETKGGLGDKYTAAIIAGLGSHFVGKATGGGAEGMLTRAMGGNRGVGGLLAGGARGLISEAPQEFGEAAFQDIGQQVAETGKVDLNQVMKRGAVEGALGGLSGGSIGAVLGGISGVQAEQAPQKLTPESLFSPEATLADLNRQTQRREPTVIQSELTEKAGLTPLVVPDVAPTSNVGRVKAVSVGPLKGDPLDNATDDELLSGIPGLKPETPVAPVAFAPEEQAASDLISAIDAGGVPLNPAKLNDVARGLGLEVESSAKPEETISRLREAVTRAQERVDAENISAERVRNSAENEQVAEPEPVKTWSGRRGDGYQTQQDAETALPGVQKRQNDLVWKVSQSPDGTYRLTGFRQEDLDRAEAAATTKRTPVNLVDSARREVEFTDATEQRGRQAEEQSTDANTAVSEARVIARRSVESSTPQTALAAEMQRAGVRRPAEVDTTRLLAPTVEETDLQRTNPDTGDALGPFTSRESAVLAIRKSDLQSTHVAVPVEGGFVGQQVQTTSGTPSRLESSPAGASVSLGGTNTPTSTFDASGSVSSAGSAPLDLKGSAGVSSTGIPGVANGQLATGTTTGTTQGPARSDQPSVQLSGVVGSTGTTGSVGATGIPAWTATQPAPGTRQSVRIADTPSATRANPAEAAETVQVLNSSREIRQAGGVRIARSTEQVEAKLPEALAAAFGRPIVWIEGRQPKQGLFFSGVTVDLRNGKTAIALDKNSTQAPVRIFFHEAGHTMPAHIRAKFIAAVRDTLTNKADFAKDFGYSQSDPKFEEEMLFKIAESEAVKPEFLKELKRRLGNKDFKAAIDHVLKTIDNLLRGFDRPDYSRFTTDIKRFRSELAKAYAQTLEETGDAAAARAVLDRQAQVDAAAKAAAKAGTTQDQTTAQNQTAGQTAAQKTESGKPGDWTPSEDEQADLQQELAEELGGSMPAFSRNEVDPKPTKIKLTDDEYNLSLLPLLYGGEAGTRGRASVREVAQELQARAEASLEKMGLAKGDITDPRMVELASKIIAAEIEVALRKPGNAADWYSGKLIGTMAVASLIYPELQSDSKSRIAFLIALAVTSQNMSVPENLKHAEDIYSAWKSTGQFPEDRGWGTASGAMKKNFARANALMSDYSPERLERFLNSQFTVGELKKAEWIVSGENVETVVYGSAVFGPKIGNGFYQNISGNFTPLTMDMWFMRGMGRIVGDLIHGSPEEFARLKAKFLATHAADAEVDWSGLEPSSDFTEETGIEEFTDENIQQDDVLIELAKRIDSWFTKEYARNGDDYKSGDRIKPAIVNAAQRLLEQGATNDVPLSGAHRNNLRTIFSGALEKLEKAGISLTNADGQAIWWFPEKDLYAALGAGNKKSAPTDYEREIIQLAKRRGKSDEQIKAAIDRAKRRARDSGATRGDGAQPETAGGPSERFGDRDRGEFLKQRVLAAYRAGTRAFKRGDGGSKGLRVSVGSTKFDAVAKWSLPLAVKNSLNAVGVATPDFYEIKSAAAFRGAIERSKDGNKFAASVYVYPEEEYAQMRLFVADGGKVGFALKGDDIVSVFGYDPDQKGAANSAVALAVQEGGRRLDAFDTVLPSIYALNGFVPTSRMKWNDDYAPDGWDKSIYQKYNGGEPDVVFMAYNPKSFKLYKQGDGQYFDDYDQAVAAQQQAVQSPTPVSGPRFSRNATRPSEPAVRSGGSPVAGEQDAGEGWSKRTPRAGSVSVAGWHYGQSKVPMLSGSMYGRGIKGKEAGRLAHSRDPRISRRVYFYIPRDDGSAPPKESGLGVHRYELTLANLYDSARSPRIDASDLNRFESSVLDAGYDGYVNRAYGMAVILNADVPARYTGVDASGPRPAEPAPQARLKKALMSREIGPVEAIVDRIPGARVRNGNLEVDAEYKDLANDVLASADVGIRFSRREKPDPKKTVTAYKLFRVDQRKPGQLFPLFVDANTPVEMGEWLDADIGPSAGGGKVKSKLGPLAFRPGWHGGDLPVATHIGSKSSPNAKAPDIRPENHVWAEVEFAADVDWQAEANRRGTNVNGRIVPVKAHITDQIPVDGFYRYKTNPNMTGNWLISGSMKVVRVLSDAEVRSINDAAGVADLPRQAPFEPDRFGLKFSRNQIQTPEFKAWFGDSKVVDANGEPLVVYHGSTAKGVTVFDTTRITTRSAKGDVAGTYFTADQRAASGYTRPMGANIRTPRGEIIAAHLRIENPLNTTTTIKRHLKQGMSFSDAKRKALEALSPEHDGIIFDGNGVNPSEFVVFSPEQIKSAIGNNGQFSRESPDIRFSRNQTETPEFQRWFGDSKIVDAEGRPLAVYHGTGVDFSVFDADAEGNHLKLPGIFFTPDPSMASMFAENDAKMRENKAGRSFAPNGAQVMPVYLSMQNPLEEDVSKGGQKGFYPPSAIRDLILEAQRLGRDGVILRGWQDGSGPVQYIVFRPEQIKSAIGNSGQFDPGNPDIRFARNRQTPPYGGVSLSGSRFTLDGETKGDLVRRKVQDSMLRMKRVQDMIVGQGGTVTERSNVYEKETLSYGRKQSIMDSFKDDVFQPFVQRLVDADITMDELALYAYAKHAPERNAEMQRRNPNVFTGSGMDDQAAQIVVGQVAGGPKAAEYESLRQDLLRMAKMTRQKLLDYGLITPAQLLAMESQYQDYVPLRGFGEVENDVIIPGEQPEKRKTPGPKGRKVDVRGNPTLRALGRDSLASGVVENIIGDYERAISRGEDNLVARSFLKFVQDNPDPDLWEINAKVKERRIDPRTGQVIEAWVVDEGPETVGVRVAGQQVFIRVKDPLLVRALTQGFKDDTSGKFAAALHEVGVDKYGNWLRNTLTQWNPVFVLPNTVRDLQAGAASVLETLGPEGLNRFRKALPGAYAAATRASMGKQGGSQWDAIYNEFTRSGGITGGFYGRDIETIREDIQTLIALTGGRSTSILAQIRGSKGLKLATSFLSLVEHVGSASENGTRVAAYKVARDMGKTPAEAAVIAKNLTTNFNRKGEWGAALNVLYLFYNASVQGSVRTVEALANSKHVRYAMAAVTGMTLGLALLNASAGGEDDDGEKFWDKIPDYEKERNLIVMLPPGTEAIGVSKVGKTGRYLKLPLPYGFNVFTVAGYNLADVGRYLASDGKEGVSVGKGALRIASSMMGSFNPFGGAITGEHQAWLAALPTIADAVYQLRNEVNSFGTPVSPKKYDENQPDSDRFNSKQAGGIAQRLTTWAFEKTAPSPYLPTIDINPGTLENIAGVAGGGLGRFIYDVAVNVPTKLLHGDEIHPKDVPFWRNVQGEVTGDEDVRQAWDRAIENKRLLADMKHGIHVNLDDPENRALKAIEGSVKSFTKSMKELKKEEIELMTSDKPASEKAEGRRSIRMRQKEAALSLNVDYMKNVKGEK